MIRVLQVYPQMNSAGTEAVIMNLYRNIDQGNVHFDFLTQRPGLIDDEIRAMGGRIFYLSNNNKHEYYKSLLDFFDNHKYNAVHTHTHAEMGMVMRVAKKQGIKHRIAHSHNSREDLPAIFKLYKRITGIPIEQNANHFFACSELAAKWLFPAKWKECVILPNAIELEKFAYDEKARRTVRTGFGFDENDKVICHVGRFAEQKNHKRIISILNEIIARDGSIKALLAGDGPLFNEIKSQSKSDNIRFLGNVSNVPDILNASDMFLFPSLHEGLGIVLIEAQASGLSCVASDAVPTEADIGLGLLKRLSLKEDNNKWISNIGKALNKTGRKELSTAALSSRYNIKTIGKQMEDFYLGLE